MHIVVVETEHPEAVDAAVDGSYAALANRLRAAGADAVDRVPYPAFDGVDGADALVLGGSFAPWAAHDEEALARLAEVVLGQTVPVLGICAGMQLQALFAGGRVKTARSEPRVGFCEIDVLDHEDVLVGLGARATVYHHHTDEVVGLPHGFRVLAASADCAVEAIADSARRWWGTQFHPERSDARHPDGQLILARFVRLVRGE